MPRKKQQQNPDALLKAYDAQLGPPKNWREALVREQTRRAVAEARKAELEALEAGRNVFTRAQFEAAVRAIQHAWEKVLGTLPQRVLAALVTADPHAKAQVADALIAELKRCGAMVASELKAYGVDHGEEEASQPGA